MIQKVIKDKIDIDKILIVTFTNAAASEMRERILEAIYKKIEEEPENQNLQRQILLLNKASICTIHSFCLEVIRNNFYEIDTSANFRIGDTAEVELLKQEVLEDLMEEQYEKENPNFINLLNTYTTYRGDEPLKQLILTIYNSIQSNPFPEKWLSEQIEKFKQDNQSEFSQTIWAKIILEYIEEEITDCCIQLGKLQKELEKWTELEKYTNVIKEDKIQLEQIQVKANSWNSLYNATNQMIWNKWPVDRKVTLDLKNQAKEVRDSVKKKYQTAIQIISSRTEEQASNEIKEMYGILKAMEELIISFTQRFAQKKKEKNLIDFNDIEHFALEILLREQDGEWIPTEVAKKYQEKFNEIAVDEYQDSNLVQEFILSSISNGKNRFMVGDVKQSIYKFRQAKPEIFLEKYQTYKKKKTEGEGLVIQLFKNFRSRKSVLNITNFVFESIMSQKLGTINYTKEEYLNLGADYPKLENMDKEHAGIAELHILDLKDENEEEQEQESEEILENAILEAKMVVQKIKHLIDSNYQVYDKKKGYRNITYRDIVILLRSTASTAPLYEKEMMQNNIPVFSDISSEYFESMEIQVILALLKIMDNPMQDIPLVTVLRSEIGGLDDNELMQIRLIDRNSTFYETLLKAQTQVEGELKEKIQTFLTRLQMWREQEKYMALDELIWKIYQDTNFYHYVNLMSNGGIRQANLRLLFEKAKQYEKASFKGLFQFINFIDKLKHTSGDMASAKLIGENEDVVRIMSIHKSKGLEFPVVFLCGTGKKINMQDLTDKILIHSEIGLGINYIDSKRKLEYPTITKEAIKIKSKYETLSEEMRVLYVALTRAKERLFITGTTKDIIKRIHEKDEILELYKKDTSVVPIASTIIKKFSSYLDWLELVYCNAKQKRIQDSIMKLEIHTKSEIMGSEKQKKNEEKQEDYLKILNEKERIIEKNISEEIEKKLEWKYPYQQETQLPTKTSVTNLKSKKQKEIYTDDEKEEFLTQITQVPEFTKQDGKLSNAQKGTILHLCVQKLDHTKEYTKEMIAEFLEELVEKQILTQKEIETVSIQTLIQYMESDLWKELKQAKEVHKEQPFYIQLPVKDWFDEAKDTKENILVQGMIDLYYINNKNELILVDYKTDYLKKGHEKELIEKYQIPLQIYKQALEEALQRPVNQVVLYHFGKAQKQIIISEI